MGIADFAHTKSMGKICGEWGMGNRYAWGMCITHKKCHNIILRSNQFWVMPFMPMPRVWLFILGIANFPNTKSMGKVNLWPCITHDWNPLKLLNLDSTCHILELNRLLVILSSTKSGWLISI